MPTARPPLTLSLQFADPADRALLQRRKVARWIRAALDVPGEITVRIVGAEEGQALNREYRAKDYATNVLTFDYAHEPVVIADLVLCAPVLRREAAELGVTLEAHYAHLLVHGTLHAQGWDHEVDDEARAMEARETEVLAGLGYADPYPNFRMNLLDLANLVAVVAQAMTAALAAGRRRLDWFGVASLGCVTALGGGSVRDVLLGHYPLSWVAQPSLLLVAAGAALAAIALVRWVRALPMTFLVLDALGLVVFTVIGCNVALGLGHGALVAVVCGMATGCTGGVLRDLLCGDVPLVLRGELYATVALVTGSLYVAGLALGITHEVVLLMAMVLGFGLRMLAIRHAWRLPTFELDD